MCGIVGFLGGEMPRDGTAGAEALLSRMASRIERRGPDDAGVWCDIESRIGLGHRRLAIVDLSVAGHQPMRSATGRYELSFNGEIYNHLELRQALEQAGKAPCWRGHSDTETLLAGFEAWGIEATLKRAVGMFAFAVWCRQNRTLTLARDRLGEKPLYYGWLGHGDKAVFLFGSELKALKEHPSFEGKVDRDALCLLLRHNCIPAPFSIYQGMAKLRPGCLLTVSLRHREPVIQPYWSMAEAVAQGRANPYTGSAEEAVDALEKLLKDAIGQQMMADVPLGAFLSGGVDSSTVVALMQAQSSRPVKTFTIGFSEDGYNEAEHARAVAMHLGTEHTELYVTPQQAMAVIPSLPDLYDEPFSDSSQIPTFLVSQLARRHVTVSLSGDAGDELFCGYNRYMLAHRMLGSTAGLPRFLKKALASGLTSLSPATWDRIARPLMKLVPKRSQHSNVGDKLHKLSKLINARSADDLYRLLTSHWDDPAAVIKEAKESQAHLDHALAEFQSLDPLQRMMVLDALTYLPDDVLVKVDRASMGVSLESRVPFLDHRVVEFAWRLPQSLKLHEDQSKWVLRQVLYRHVPKALIERTKMGFGVPLDTWLRGPLRGWAEELLDEKRLTSEGFFNPALIRRKWAEHLSGKRNWQHHLWDVLMFQAWLEHNGTRSVSARQVADTSLV